MIAFIAQPIRRLYDWSLGLAAHRHAQWYPAGVSFAESSFFPVPPDIMLIPMVIADRAKAFRHALICTLASVVGGIAGYAIGALFFDLIAEPVLSFYGYGDKFEHFTDLYRQWGIWIVVAGGFTPIPYKVITIASGVASLNPLVFIAASFASRGARFFLIATLLYWFGPPIKSFIEKYLPWLALLAFLLLVAGFVVIGHVI